MDWTATKALATAFIHRSDIDWDVIQPLAVDAINGALTVQENEAAATLSLTPAAVTGWNSAPLPVDFARARAVMNNTRELDPIDIKGLLASSGAQAFYSISGGKLWAAQSSLSLVYSARIPLLVAGSDHNTLTDKYSGLLVYRLLVEAVHQTQDFEALQAHQGRYDELLGDANAAYAMTLSAGQMSRTPYAVVSN